ncbi:ABC transporter permease [Clostridiaceae bacterium]|uniref:ABC transporter permease n=2 Tax=Beduini sp. TaxID=1922300 RepID=UPI0011C8ADF7
MLWRAMLSLKKSKGKTALLFVIMLVVANLVISGLSIQSASEKSMKQIRESLGSDVTLSVNMSNMMQNRQKGQAMNQVMSPITKEMADQLKDLNYVSSYNYTISDSVNSEGMTPIETQAETQIPNGMKEEFKDGQTQTTLGDFSLSGNTTMQNVESFVDGSYELTEGKLLSETDEGLPYVVISETLAEENNLSVGSQIAVSSVDGDNTAVLEIVGIFTINSSNSMGNMMFNQQNPMNTLYVSLDTAKTITGSENLTSAVYYLDDPEHIEAFKQEAEEKTTINWETYSLDANDQMYERNISTLENMESFAAIFVIVVVIAGGSTLCLILILTIKNRTYEIGVLVSLGETKLNIIAQQFIEIAVIGVIAFTLSLGSGKLISNVISSMLVSNTSNSNVTMQMPQMGADSQESFLEMPNDRGGQKGNAFNNVFTAPQNSELDVSLTTPDILKLAGLTTLICATATLLPALYILRLSPREILVRKEG